MQAKGLRCAFRQRNAPSFIKEGDGRVDLESDVNCHGMCLSVFNVEPKSDRSIAQTSQGALTLKHYPQNCTFWYVLKNRMRL